MNQNENEIPQQGENQAEPEKITMDPSPGRKDNPFAKGVEVLGYGIGRGFESLANTLLPQSAEIDLDIPDYDYEAMGTGYDILNLTGELLPSMPIGSGLAAGTKAAFAAGRSTKKIAAAKKAVGAATRTTKIVPMDELAKGAQVVAQNKGFVGKAADFGKMVGYEAYRDGLTAFIALDSPMPEDLVMESLSIAYEEDDSEFETRLKNFANLSADALVAAGAVGGAVSTSKNLFKWVRNIRGARKADQVTEINAIEDLMSANGSGKLSRPQRKDLYKDVDSSTTGADPKALAALEDFSAADKYFTGVRQEGVGSKILQEELDGLGDLPELKTGAEYFRQVKSIEQAEFAVDVSMRKGAIQYAEALRSGNYDDMVEAVVEMGNLYTAKGHLGNYNKGMLSLQREVVSGSQFTTESLDKAIKATQPEIAPSSTLGTKLMELHTLKDNPKAFMAEAKKLTLTMELIESGGMDALSKWESKGGLSKISQVGAAAKMNNVLGTASIGRSILGNTLAAGGQGLAIKLGNAISPKVLLKLDDAQAAAWKNAISEAVESRLNVVESSLNVVSQVIAAAKVYKKPVSTLVDTTNVDASFNVLDAFAADANLQGFPAWLSRVGARSGGLSLDALQRIDGAVKADWGVKQLQVKNRAALMREGMDYEQATKVANEHAEAMVSGDIVRAQRAEQDLARLTVLEKAGSRRPRDLVVESGPFQGLNKNELEAIVDSSSAVQENTRKAMLMEPLPKPIGADSAKVIKEESFVRTFGGASSQILQTLPFGNWITQFNKVITNGTDIAWNASVNGLTSGISLAYKRAVKRGDFDVTDLSDSWLTLERRLAEGGEEGAKAMAYIQIGTAVTAASLAMLGLEEDRITGSYLSYSDVEKGKAQGTAEKSIRIGDDYYSYDTLDHAGAMLSMLADVHRIGKTAARIGDSATTEDLASSIAILIAGNLMSGKANILSVEDILGAASNNSLLESMARAAEKAGSKVITFGQARKDVGFLLSDEQIGSFDGVRERSESRFSSGRTRDRDPITFAPTKPTVAKGGVKAAEFMGLTKVTKGSDPIIQKEFREIDFVPPQMPVVYKNIDLLDPKFDIDGRSAVDQLGDILANEKGLTLRQELRREIKNPVYKRLSPFATVDGKFDSQRHKALAAIYDRHYSAAKEMLVAKNPALLKEKNERYVTKIKRESGVSTKYDDPRTLRGRATSPYATDKGTSGSPIKSPF